MQHVYLGQNSAEKAKIRKQTHTSVWTNSFIKLSKQQQLTQLEDLATNADNHLQTLFMCTVGREAGRPEGAPYARSNAQMVGRVKYEYPKESQYTGQTVLQERRYKQGLTRAELESEKSQVMESSSPVEGTNKGLACSLVRAQVQQLTGCPVGDGADRERANLGNQGVKQSPI